MSRYDEKTGKTVDVDFSALDKELAELAGETPEVPADFHDKWMQAVREDAENNPREDGTADMDRTERRKMNIRRQRRYILSAAAAFVAVIGIAWLLGGDELKKLSDNNLLNRVKTTPAPAIEQQITPEPSQASEPEEPVPAPESAAGQEEYETNQSPVQDMSMILAESVSYYSTEDYAESAADDAVAGGYASEAYYKASDEPYEAAEDAYETDEAALDMGSIFSDADAGNEEPAGAGLQLFAAMMSGNAADSTGIPKAEEKTAQGEVTEAEAEETPTPEMTPKPEITPQPTAIRETPEAFNQSSADPEASGTEEPAATQETDEAKEEENASFLQRLWDFLLRITPWMLGIAALALFLVTYAIRAKQRKRKQ